MEDDIFRTIGATIGETIGATIISGSLFYIKHLP